MNRRLPALMCICTLLVACSDDRVSLRRGPFGPADYEVTVSALTGDRDPAEEHRARLDVDPHAGGATFALRTTHGDVVAADLEVEADGSAHLARIRGADAQSAGQTELASLVGQLNPPLPSGPVRLGDRWSSTQRITTQSLSASLRTSLRMVRFTRMASVDAAEFVGDVSGSLRVTSETRSLQGRLSGDTEITWAVRAGRVVAADTHLVWTLSDGNRVTLQTSVTPR